MSLWSKRFKKKINNSFFDYTKSIGFDKKFSYIDIKFCIVHLKMLKKNKFIKKNEYKIAKIFFRKIKNKILLKKIKWKSNLEDIHLNIEKLVINKNNKIGNKIRTARSRNDLTTTELRYFLKKKIRKIFYNLKRLVKIIINISKDKIKFVMPSFTHMQIAQPTLLSHHLLAYKEMFLRDLLRLKNVYKTLDCLILGSCAAVGTSIKINRFFLKKKLNFSKINRNSLDGVSDRDYVIDFCHSCSMIMLHISRISEEFILWSSNMFEFIIIPDEYSSGSSMMPQKKNPDVFEISRSRSSIVISNLFSIYSIMKCLPLSYNKDYQEDKRISFSSYKITIETIKILINVIKKIKFKKKNMYNTSKKNFSLSTDFAEKLTKLGTPYKKAHSIVSLIVSKFYKYRSFENIPKKKFLKVGIKKSLINWIKNLSVLDSVNLKKNIGNTSTKRVKKEIKRSFLQIKKILL
ncbi:argininosuccinate lyase [Candidatus Vidania fulgoroideorum]